VVFVGAGRGGLSPTQRAEVLAFAQNWKREATGGVTVDRPSGTANERAASDTLKEALSIMAQAGVPQNGIGIRPYTPASKNATLRLSYPLTTAQAGPCGLWPDDLGPSYDAKHFENRQFYNFGCATQRNLASMAAEPADLVQPRGETPVYTAKRTFGTDKWRKGETPATTYPDATKGAISDLGK
jgi:pilus assembly protein CpaD